MYFCGGDGDGSDGDDISSNGVAKEEMAHALHCCTNIYKPAAVTACTVTTTIVKKGHKIYTSTDGNSKSRQAIKWGTERSVVRVT